MGCFHLCFYQYDKFFFFIFFEVKRRLKQS
jgi:hypothetical protein